MCDTNYMYLDVDHRFYYSNLNWHLEKRRKIKNKEEYKWNNVGFYSKLSHLYNEVAKRLKIKHCENIKELNEAFNNMLEKIAEFNDIIIKDGTPTVIQERVIIEYRTEVLKEDGRCAGGLKHVENKNERKVIKDDTKKKDKEINFEFC